MFLTCPAYRDILSNVHQFFSRFGCLTFLLSFSPKVKIAHEVFLLTGTNQNSFPWRATAAVGNKTLPSSGTILEEPLKIATPPRVD